MYDAPTLQSNCNLERRAEVKIWKTGGLRKAQENTLLLKKASKLDDFRKFGQTVRDLKEFC